MKLLTYRIDSELGFVRKISFLQVLYKKLLHRDKYWHFFLDPEGGTLRTSRKFEEEVLAFTKGFDPQIRVKKRLLYDPKLHEYYGVDLLGDDILPMFHEMSVLAVKYPPFVNLRTAFERMNHCFINMSGIHDFKKEADIYYKLATSRLALIGKRLKWKLRLWFFIGELLAKLK